MEIFSSDLIDAKSNSTPNCVLCKEPQFTPGCRTCDNILLYRESLTNNDTSKEKVSEISNVEFPGPGVVKNTPIYGNYVVASRTIESGELVCLEKPLLVAPYGPTDRLPLCLSCYSDVAFSPKCSKCRWPICSYECEMNLSHAENECPIFSEKGLKPKGVANEYFSIETLRCLRLRERSSSKWDRIMSFEAHLGQRKENKKAQETLEFITKFIWEKCGLTEYDAETINQVVGVLSVNTFWAYKDLKIYASVLFDKVTLLAHDCDPNTRRELVKLQSSEDVLDHYAECGIGIEVHATRQIEKGEMITIGYLDVSQPVLERREELRTIFYFDCACSKCLQDLLNNNLSICDGNEIVDNQTEVAG